jgi:transcriptional regulator with XRE-family HTH domain
MSNLIARLEQARVAARMSQQQLGTKLGVTQGHYSKVVTGRAPLSEGLRENIETWLKAQGTDDGASEVTKRMQELAASIRRECGELMQLAGVIGGETSMDDLGAE